MKNYLILPDVRIQYYIQNELANFEIEYATPNILHLFDNSIKIKSIELLSCNITIEDGSDDLTRQEDSTISMAKLISQIDAYQDNELLSIRFEFAEAKGFVKFEDAKLSFTHQSKEYIFRFVKNLFAHYPEIKTPEPEMLTVRQGKKMGWCEKNVDWCNVVGFFTPNIVPDSFSIEQKVEFWQNNEMLFLHWVSEYFPLNSSQILKYKKQLDWRSISVNLLIEWDGNTLELCKDRIIWSDFTIKHRLPYRGKQDEEFYKTFDWNTIDNLELCLHKIVSSYFEQFPDSKILYKVESISCVPKIPYAHIYFGTRHKDIAPEAAEKLIQLAINTDSKIEDQMSSYIPKEYLRSFNDFMDWYHLSMNINLPWDFALLFEYEYWWHYLTLSYNTTAFQFTLKEDLNVKFIDRVMLEIDDCYQHCEFERMEIEEAIKL
ncbi:hypothetical protein [Candidatus Venteria ishoeyi]|uniref:Uncharacterized protein n=1 Tax=Candidatus Venteria ishoeyi TaxID=1899563 RepID=A0A1H6F6L6_9GAMM|nr:hypothetical protein [Candidatus Venteria ishoeyi]SEH05041.1 Uncharacterised protein [Candidatus Venteria ishoeyi]